MFDNVLCVGEPQEAEFTKMMENMQRDVNIAFMNNMKMIADDLNIDFDTCKLGAKTKPSFSKFDNGLVGGTCINNDIYFFMNSVAETGATHHLGFLSNTTSVNDAYLNYVIDETKKDILKKVIDNKGLSVLLCGTGYKSKTDSEIGSKNTVAIDDIVNSFKNCTYIDISVQSKYYELEDKIKGNRYDVCYVFSGFHDYGELNATEIIEVNTTRR
jgi:UDP-N-acetyl-D-galactosamine dehydrogenase